MIQNVELGFFKAHLSCSQDSRLFSNSAFVPDRSQGQKGMSPDIRVSHAHSFVCYINDVYIDSLNVCCLPFVLEIVLLLFLQFPGLKSATLPVAKSPGWILLRASRQETICKDSLLMFLPALTVIFQESASSRNIALWQLLVTVDSIPYDRLT